MLQEQVKSKNTLPSNHLIKIFFIKLIVMVTVWELGYNFFLKPLRVPDKFLTDIITAGSVFFINLFSLASSHVSWIDIAAGSTTYIEQAGQRIFYIADICNGLDLLVIYLGFIILLPSSLKRKIIFSAAGIPVIIFANILRCTFLYWIAIKHRSMFEVNHHYIFSILMYLLIFYGWILFIGKPKKHEIH